MPQGDQKDLKARVGLKEKILKLTKDLSKVESDIAKTLDDQGTKSDDLVTKRKKLRKELDSSRASASKGQKDENSEAQKASKERIKESEKWGKSLSDKVAKSIEEITAKNKAFGGETKSAWGEMVLKAAEWKAEGKEGADQAAELAKQIVEAGIAMEELKASGVATNDQIKKATKLMQDLDEKSKKTFVDNFSSGRDTSKKIADNAKKTANSMGTLKSSSSRWLKGLISAKAIWGYILIAVAAVGAGMVKMAESAVKVQNELGIASGEALKFAFSWRKMAHSMLGIDPGIQSAKRALAIAGSDITMLTEKSEQWAKNIAWAAKNTGTSATKLAEVQEILMLNTDLTRDGANNMIMGIEAFVRGAGGIPKEVFEDIASSTEEIAKFTDGSADSIARAATMANKLGLNLKDASSMATSLLNLESSIASEFEASVLIGRELNYDKARSLTLSNDLEGAMKEIVSQLGSEEEFLQMNAIQRQAIADSIGASVDDISKMIGYGADGGAEVDPKIKLQKQSNKTLKDIYNTILNSPAMVASAIGLAFKGIMMGLGMFSGAKMLTKIASWLRPGGSWTKWMVEKSGQYTVRHGFEWIWGKLVSFKNFIMKPFTWLGKGVDKGFELLGKFTTKLIEKISWLWGKWKAFKPFTALGNLTGRFLGYFKNLTTFLGKAGPIAKFLGYLRPFLSKISGWLAPLFDIFQTFFGKGKGDTEAGASGMTFGAVGAGIGALLAPFTGGLSILAGYAIGSIVGHLVNHFFPAVGKKIVSWANSIGDGFMGALGWVMDIPNKIGALASTAYDNTIGAGIQIGKDAINAWNESYPVWKADMIQSFKDTWIGLGDSIVATVSDLWNSMYQPIEDMGTALIEKVKEVMNFDLSGWVGKKWDETSILPTWLGGDGGKKVNDFIWRPGEGIQKFSKDDNLLGMKDLSMLNQAGSGAASETKMAQQLAILTTINQNLAPLVALVASNEGILAETKNNKIVGST